MDCGVSQELRDKDVRTINTDKSLSDVFFMSFLNG